MKRSGIFAMFLCLLLLSVMSVSAQSANSSGKAGAQGKKLVIANLPKSVGGAWFNRMKVGIERYGKDTGNDAFQTGADKSDAALQVKEVENLIEQGVDVITVVPVSPQALEPVLQTARQKGIIVISQEAQGIKNADYDVEAFDGAAYGAHVMDKLAEGMGKSGDYIISVGSLTAASHMSWANGALARQKSAYPNMKCINEKAFIESNYDQKASQEKAAELMKTYPNLKGMFVTSATDLPGYALAVEEANKAGKVILVGNGVPNVNKTYLQSKALAYLGCWDPADAGYVMAKVGEILKSGGKISDGQNLGVKGYEKITVQGNVIMGSAWKDITPASPAGDWF
ncbi:MAG: substrate-binding domain-containing protein [Treponema sp.]|nr:substrate-binding domain-containing protein [Treponema sp.]